MSLVVESPQEVFAKMQAGEDVQIVDVRTPREFEALHAQGAHNVPLDRLDARTLPVKPPSQLYVICQSGTRARQAAERLAKQGIAVVCIEGGTAAWQSAGQPVVRGRATISLERQVRIVAGSLVVLGVILGAFVHPYWLALSAFVGLGLINAGVTDLCPMAGLLTRLPWNAPAPGSSPGSSHGSSGGSAGSARSCCKQ